MVRFDDQAVGSRSTTAETIRLPPTPAQLAKLEQNIAKRRTSLYETTNKLPATEPTRISALRSFIARPRRWKGNSTARESPRVTKDTLSSSSSVLLSHAMSDPEPTPLPSQSIIREGILDKWTGQLGRWKARYVIIQPGVLKYKQLTSDSVRHIPLAGVTVEKGGEPHSPVISLRTQNNVIHWRVSRREDRSDWVKAIIKAKQQRDSPLSMRHPRPITASSIDAIEPFVVGNSPSMAASDVLDEWLSDEAINLQPMKRLAEINAEFHARQSDSLNELTLVTGHMIRTLALFRDPLTSSLREQLTTLLKLTDTIQEVFEKHNRAVAKLGVEEVHEMRRLQTTLKRTLKENWKLERRVHKLTSKVEPESSKATEAGAAAEEFFDVDDEHESASSDTSSSDSMLTDTDEAAKPPAVKVAEPVLARAPSETICLGLPRPTVAMRTRLPMPRTEFKVSMWSLLKDCVGKDLSRIALPVYFNEPTSFLQRLAEDYQYAHLLERAALTADPTERLLWTTIYTLTPFASAVGRSYKPFNPLLGETYEMVHRGFRFLGEQVGHHPPTSAYHAHGAGFTATGHLTVHTKFTGKSLEVAMLGPSNIYLDHPNGHQELYTFQKARMIVNNIIFGRISIDMAGTYTVTNHTTGDYGVVEFPKKGWWTKDVHPVRGLICDSQGRCKYRFHGVWSQSITAEKVLPSLEKLTPNYRLPNPKPPLLNYGRKLVDFNMSIWTSLQTDKTSLPFLAWQVDPRPPYAAQFYEFGYMTFELNEIVSIYDRDNGAIIPPTDSRYRPDQRALEEGRVEVSNTEKVRLEEKQRAAARAMPRGEKDHKPGWYTRCVDPVSGCEAWQFDPTYWKARDLPRDEAEELYKNRCLDIF